MKKLTSALVLAVLALAPMQPAAAAWRDEVQVFRIGILVGDNPTYRIAQAEPFRRYMEDRLGVPVEIFPATNLTSLVEGQSDGRVHYAVHSATSFLAANARCSCIEPIVAPATPDGTAGFYAIALARSDGPIDSLAAAKGMRLAVAAEDSIAGRRLPLALFAAQGMPAETHFSALIETADPEASVQALLDGRAEIALAWSSLSGDPAGGFSRGVLHKMVVEGSLAMASLRLIWQSPLIPSGPHAIRADLPADLKAELLPMLLGMAAADPAAYASVDLTGGVQFVPADPALYKVLEPLVAPSAP